jgi:hypothetical protein
MKPITLKQWEKARPRSRDWLLNKALGGWVKVYWHVSRDGSRKEIASGSYDSRDYAEIVLTRHFPETARIRRDLCYLAYTTVPNCAQHVIDEMLKRGWRCRLDFDPFNQPRGFRTAQFYKSHEESFFYDSTHIEEAIAAAALQALGFMEQYPF